MCENEILNNFFASCFYESGDVLEVSMVFIARQHTAADARY